MSDAPQLGALGVTRDEATRLKRLLNRKFVFGGALQGRITEDVIALFVPPVQTVAAAGGGTSIFRSQVTARLLSPFRLQVKKIKSDGSLDTTVLDVKVDTFESPADWDNVTPSIAIGTVVPIYQGVDLADGSSTWWLLWPVSGTGPCT